MCAHGGESKSMADEIASLRSQLRQSLQQQQVSPTNARHTTHNRLPAHVLGDAFAVFSSPLGVGDSCGLACWFGAQGWRVCLVPCNLPPPPRHAGRTRAAMPVMPVSWQHASVMPVRQHAGGRMLPRCHALVCQGVRLQVRVWCVERARDALMWSVSQALADFWSLEKSRFEAMEAAFIEQTRQQQHQQQGHDSEGAVARGQHEWNGLDAHR